MAEHGFFVKQRVAVRAVQPRSTYSWHGSHIALNGRLIGVGQQLPRRMKLETGVALRSFTFGRSGRDRLVLQGGNVLVFGDNAFDRLGVLMPEQEICSQLEILGCMKGDKMDVVQRCDDV